MNRNTLCLFLAALSPMMPGDNPPSDKNGLAARLLPVVRMPYTSEIIAIPFTLNNQSQETIKVVLLPNDPNSRTMAFLEFQLFKDGKALPYDVQVRPPVFDKRHVRDIKGEARLNVDLNLSHVYLSKTLKPGEYEVRVKYKLAPGSEAATYWGKELGVTPLTIEQSIWLILESKK